MAYVLMALVVMANTVMAYVVMAYVAMAYRVDWEPAAPSRRRILGVSWGCPAALWGTIYTQSNPGFS